MTPNAYFDSGRRCRSGQKSTIQGSKQNIQRTLTVFRTGDPIGQAEPSVGAFASRQIRPKTNPFLSVKGGPGSLMI
jgi:hypothetical protein